MVGVAALALTVGLGWLALRLGEPDPPEVLPHTTYPEDRLRELHGQAPRPGLMLPRELPIAVVEAARSGALADDQTSFELMNVFVESERRRRNRSVETVYVSDLMGVPGNGARFRVTQTSTGAEPLSESCPDSADMPSIVREVAGASVRICSMALWEGSDARDYWENVEFTSDLSKAKWLWR